MTQENTQMEATLLQPLLVQDMATVYSQCSIFITFRFLPTKTYTSPLVGSKPTCLT